MRCGRGLKAGWLASEASQGLLQAWRRPEKHHHGCQRVPAWKVWGLRRGGRPQARAQGGSGMASRVCSGCLSWPDWLIAPPPGSQPVAQHPPRFSGLARCACGPWLAPPTRHQCCGSPPRSCGKAEMHGLKIEEGDHVVERWAGILL